MDKDLYLKKMKTAIAEAGYDSVYQDACISYAERLYNNNLPVIFDAVHFSRLLGVELDYLHKILFANECFYAQKSIPKRSGGYRLLEIPALELKSIQRWILDNILKNISVSKFAMGFRDHKSIVDNAKVHLNKQCVINMDIKDFFPSISFEQVFRIFYYFGYTKEVSFFLARICTFKGHLPQGAPTSPYLSNIIALKLDARLSALAKTYQADYTRYADDLTFSGGTKMYKLVGIVHGIVHDEGFRINANKTRIQYKGERQEVTGIIVNGDRVKVNRNYKRELEQQIYYCKKYGVDDHLKKIGCVKTFYKEHLYGKAYFIKMVEPEAGKKFLASLDEIKWDY